MAVTKATLEEFIEDPEIAEYFSGLFRRDFDIFQEALREGGITEGMRQRYDLTKERLQQIFIKMKRILTRFKPNPDETERLERFWSKVRTTGADRDVCFLPGLNYKTANKLSQ